VGLSRETLHTADSAYDPGGQYGTHAEDLCEGGARCFHLGFDTLVEVSDLPIQRTDVAQHLGGQAPAQAGRSTLGPYAAQDACGSMGRKRSGHPAGHEVPQEPVEAVERPCTLGYQVNKRLSESRRSTSDAASGSTAANLSLREAAKAVARASRRSFLRALTAKLERAPAPVPKA
jgi:hypothetical protein